MANIDRLNLEQTLRHLSAPCFESELLSAAFQKFGIMQASALELYQHHFLLFHMLYVLQNEFRQEGRYLHIHFMRTMLLSYPCADECRHYLADPGVFCKEPVIAGRELCHHHLEIVGEHALEHLSERWFYLDESNFFSFDAESAEAFINGAWQLLKNSGEFDQSLAALELPRSPTLPMVRQAFRRLAKKFHPDVGGDDKDKFFRINRAYRFLMQVLPSMLQARSSQIVDC